MKIAIIVLAAFLTGCATTAVISDLEEDKVVVDASGDDKAVIEAEAAKGCAMHNRQAVPVSYSCVDGYCVRKRYLFACK